MNSFAFSLNHLTPANRELRDLVLERERLYRIDPERLFPRLLRPCRVRVLLVTDGGLDFSLGDFGLRTFVDVLTSQPPGPYVRFDVTVAHINQNATDEQVMAGHSDVERSIKGFKFDDPEDFAPDMYDEVWLFGIDTFYSEFERGPGYPSSRLSDSELRALSEFMDGDGGVFATGDHGALGVCLCGSIPRVRSMRLWGSTSGSPNLDEVSMGGSRRNDTNRRGHDVTSEFDDQSDDVPQTVNPKMYTAQSGIWRYAWPHPILCGPKGPIRVMPDHPHEGECVEPSNTSHSETFDGYEIEEYPSGSGGSARPLPEVISTSNVPAGNTSGIVEFNFVKAATQPHTFGGICAYDGHRAGRGRVVTDATWHHFVNVNLIGETGALPPKNAGFLATPAGQDHLETIKTYYRNIAVWIARPSLIRCMNRRILWGLLWQHRVLEAVTTRLDVQFKEVDVRFLYDLGLHARDVLGKYAGPCQSRRIALDVLERFFPRERIEFLDPWRPRLEEKEPERSQGELPWLNLEPMMDVALGGALLSLREAFPYPDSKALDEAEDRFDEVLERGVVRAVKKAQETADPAVKLFRSFLGGGTQ